MPASTSTRFLALALALLVTLSTFTTAATVPSAAVVTLAKTALTQLINGNPQNFIPGFVRLAFHDCVSAKCDACVDLSSADNRGLDNRVSALNSLYDQRADISATMSRADFWMLAMVTASEIGNNNNGIPGLVMNFGRDSSSNCPASEATGVSFPKAHGNSTATFAFFNQVFGFTPAEVTALLGMHSLGHVQQANSGFTFGPWVNNAGPVPTRVTNAYYRNLANPPWTQTDASPNAAEHHYQWTNRGQRSGFLNADMGLLKDFRTDDNGRASCLRANGGQNTCPDGATAPIVRNFANNNNAWLQAVGPVLTKMIEHGYSAGQLTFVAGGTNPVPGVRPVNTRAPAPARTQRPAPPPPPPRPTGRPGPGPNGGGGRP